MSEEPKRVKHLPEAEQMELIKQMELAGCRGNLKEYNLEIARKKVEEWQKNNKPQSVQTSTEGQTVLPGATANDDVQESANLNSESGQEEATEPEQTVLPGIQLSNDATHKKLICHICRSEVVNGVCTGCGFRM